MNLSKLLTSNAQNTKASLVRELLHYSQQPDMLSLAGGLPDERFMPPYPSIDNVTASQQYGASEGEPILRQQISSIVKERGIATSPDQVLVTSGSQQGLDLIGRMILDDSSIVLTEQPTYLAAIQVFELQGATIKEVPSDEFGMDLSALRNAIEKYDPKAVYLIPNFQNPAGHCYSAKRREDIAKLLDEKGVLLIEDDPYRDLCYDEVDLTPISSQLTTTPWIYLGSFSKVLWPGVRMGFIVSCVEIMPYLVRIKQATDLHTSRLSQLVVSSYLASGDFADHITTLREVYRQKRDIMVEAIDQNLAGLVEYEVPKGGMFFWLKLPVGVSSERVLRDALIQNVLILPGAPFFANESALNDSYMRLSFARVSEDDLKKAISILASVVKSQLDDSRLAV